MTTSSSLPAHYRDILRSELSLRFRKNPHYSLRAFARDLSLSSARLSEVMQGKKGLSRRAAELIANKLGLNSDEKNHFCDLVEAEHARSKLTKEEAKKRIKARLKSIKNNEKTYNLTLDSFRIIEDWYHTAILQLLKLPHPSQDKDEIAKLLNLSPHQVQDAFDRLVRLELIEKKGNQYIVLENWVTHKGKTPSNSIKKYHEQLIDRSKVSLYHDSIDRRTFRSSVLSVDLKKIPEIESEIKKFSERIIEHYSTTTQNSEVAALTIQFFPLTQKPSGEL